MKSRNAMAKTAFCKKKMKKKKTLHQQTDLNLRKKLVYRYVWSTAFYGAETLTIRTVDQKHLGSFEVKRLRRKEKIGWTDRVRNEEVLQRVKKEWNVLHTINRMKADYIGHIWRRNCFIRHATEGKIRGRSEVTGRGRRRKQLLDDFERQDTGN